MIHFRIFNKDQTQLLSLIDLAQLKLDKKTELHKHINLDKLQSDNPDSELLRFLRGEKDYIEKDVKEKFYFAVLTYLVMNVDYEERNIKFCLDRIGNRIDSVIEKSISIGEGKEIKPGFMMEANKNSLLLHSIASGMCNNSLLLLKKGANPFVQDHEGKTPLHLLIAKGHVKDIPGDQREDQRPVISKIINDASKTDLEKVDDRGNTALHIACLRGDYETARLLFEKKVDVNIKNKDGLTPLDLMKKNFQESNSLVRDYSGGNESMYTSFTQEDLRKNRKRIKTVLFKIFTEEERSDEQEAEEESGAIIEESVKEISRKIKDSGFKTAKSFFVKLGKIDELSSANFISDAASSGVYGVKINGQNFLVFHNNIDDEDINIASIAEKIDKEQQISCGDLRKALFDGKYEIQVKMEREIKDCSDPLVLKDGGWFFVNESFLVNTIGMPNNSLRDIEEQARKDAEESKKLSRIQTKFIKKDVMVLGSNRHYYISKPNQEISKPQKEEGGFDKLDPKTFSFSTEKDLGDPDQAKQAYKVAFAEATSLAMSKLENILDEDKVKFAVLISLIAIKNGGIGGSKKHRELLREDLIKYTGDSFKDNYVSDAINFSASFQEEMKNMKFLTGREKTSEDKTYVGTRLKRAATPDNLLWMLTNAGKLKDEAQETLDQVSSTIGLVPAASPSSTSASQLQRPKLAECER